MFAILRKGEFQMRTKHRESRTLIYPLIAFLAIVLIISTAPSLCAKGAQRTSPGDSGDRSYTAPRDGGSGSPSYGQSNRSDSRSEPKSEPRVEPRPEPRPEPRSESRYVPAPEPRSEPRSEPRYEPTPQPRSEPRYVPKPEPRSEPRYEPRVEPQVERRSEPAPEPRVESRSAPKVEPRSDATPQYTPRPESRSGDSSSGDPTISRQGNQPQVQAPQRLKGPSGPPSPTITRSDTRQPIDSAAPQRSTSRTESRAPSVGVYRKEHAELADLWKTRREYQERHSGSRDRDHNRGSNVHVNINIFPGTYRYYCYDYDPWYCYPSVYCYYYGWYPPYIRNHRVFWVYREVRIVYTWVEIPITLVYHEYPTYSGYDSYYLTGWKYRTLATALKDIERAWERSDADLLAKHVRRDSKMDVFLKGEYTYSLERQDYLDMTSDAMSNIRTEKFEIYRTRERDRYAVVAYGKHTYYDYEYRQDSSDLPSQTRRNTVYVTYTLERSGDEWYITEVGSSPNRPD